MADWADFLADASKQMHKGPQCSISRMLAELPPEDREIVRRVVEDVTIQASSVARALEKRLGDKAPKRQVISNHRRQECACRKEDA